MATKFSAIAAAGAITGTDKILGVQAGPTDVVYTAATITAFALASPTITGTATIQTSLAIAGAAIGTDVLAWTGTATGSGQLNAYSFVPTSATVPTNGMYLGSANTLSFSTASGQRWNIVAGGSFTNANSGGARLAIAIASSTTPTVIPNNNDLTTGIGAQASGNISLIAAATERVRIATGAASVSDVLLPGTLFTGGSGTTTFPQIFVQPTGTTAATAWSTGGTIFGANAVSGFSGNFLDFRAGGAGSVFSVNQNGGTVQSSSSQIGGAAVYSWTARGIISSPAAGAIQLGIADTDTNAAIVAQTIRSQGALAGGTADQAGKNLTVIVSPGKGTGAGGSFIVQTSPAGSTGTAVNAPVTALTIDSTGKTTIASGKIFQIGNAATTGLAAGVLAATTNATIVITDSTGQNYRIPCIV